MAGIVLAGGAARRFGGDKCLAEVRGVALVQRVVETLAPLVAEIIVATRPGSEASLTFLGEREDVSVRVVADRHPGRGPLGGLEAGLVATRHAGGLLVGCDQPFVSPRLVEGLREAWRGHDAVAYRAAGALQPMPALYDRACLPAVAELLEDPSAGPTDLLQRVAMCELDEEQARAADPRLVSFLALDTRRALGDAESGVEP